MQGVGARGGIQHGHMLHIRVRGVQRAETSRLLDCHLFTDDLLQMELCPLDGVERRLEELLRRVLLADVLLGEPMFAELLDEESVPRHEVLFREARVVDKCIVLKKVSVSSTSHHVGTKKHCGERGGQKA